MWEAITANGVGFLPSCTGMNTQLWSSFSVHCVALKYEYLWKTDLSVIFQEFLDEAITSEMVPFQDNVEATTSETAAEPVEIWFQMSLY